MINWIRGFKVLLILIVLICGSCKNQNDNSNLKLVSLNEEANQLMEKGKWECTLAAISKYEDALKLTNSEETRAALFRNIGRAYYQLHKDGEALEKFQAELDIQTKLGNQKEQAETLLNMGRVFLNPFNNADEINKGLGYLDQALNINKSLQDKRLEGNILSVKGYLSYKLSVNDRKNTELHKRNAEMYDEAALVIFTGLGIKEEMARSSNNLGWDLFESNKNKSFLLWQQTLNISRDMGNKFLEARAREGIGRYFFSQKNLDEGEKNYKESIKIFRELKMIEDLDAMYSNLEERYREFGKEEKLKEIVEERKSIEKLKEALNKSNCS